MKDDKSWKGIFAIVGVILLVISVVTAIIVFRDQLEELISSAKNKIKEKKEAAFEDEFSDFADI